MGLATQIGYVGMAGKAGAAMGTEGDWQSEAAQTRCWRSQNEDRELVLHFRRLQLSVIGSEGAVLLCGYAADHANDRLLAQEDAAQFVWQGYKRSGRPPVEELEGCYTLLILDKLRGRVQIYRNLCSNHSVYYTEWNGCLWFASNAAMLVRACPMPTACNQPMLPAFFLFRSVPGRETLFQGVYRLMPGELLSYGENGLSVRVLQTFADFEEPGPTTAEVVDRFEEVMSRVMRDIAHLDLRAANLLSGGVDSSLLQIYWNKAIAGSGVRPASVEVVVPHSRTEADHEYARSAAEFLGTSHHTVTAAEAYPDSLQAQISATGEPPHHVQTAYVTQLARFMNSVGFGAGLCGEGADSLFGTDCSATLARALRLQRVPGSMILRPCLAALAALLRKPAWGDVLHVLGRTSDYGSPNHPVNRIAVFADMPSVGACFCAEEVSQAFASRRKLASDQVSGDTCRFVDFTGFLGSALQTAALWTALCELEGVNLYCPYLDSRVVRIAVNLGAEFRWRQGQTKWVLKSALVRHVPEELVRRPKRGFGQPIFEWLSEGGQLRAFAEQIAGYDFVPPRVREQALAKPTWFLYSLLCYDIWHKTFVSNRMGGPEAW